MVVRHLDQEVLRRLASSVAEIAALSVQHENRELWTRLNGLRPVRPMALMDQIPWAELEVDAELELLTEDQDCRSFELQLRQTLYKWNHLRLDMVVEPIIEVGKVITTTGFGVEVHEAVLSDDPHGYIASHHFSDQLATEADVQRMRTPQLDLDVHATTSLESKAHEFFDGILEVRMQGALPFWNMWDEIVTLRGAQPVLYDLAARPDHMHAIASAYTDACMGMLDQLEAKGLFGSDQALVHCTGAWTDELPAPGYDPSRPRALDLWTFGMAQILGSVSPSMFEEFEIPYAIRWFERFGLGYYGCCDPLHERVDIVRRIPNVRKISMSPWVDVEVGAAAIGPDYVFSYKPSPAHLARETFPRELIERELRHVIDACERAGSPLEIILKDISTVRREPQRLWEWAELATGIIHG